MQLERVARYFESFVATVLSPPRCGSCDEPVAESRLFCVECGDVPEAAGERLLAQDVPLIAAAKYEAPLARMIHRFKYEDIPEFARPLGTLIAARLKELEIEGAATCVPVPLHARRLAERGYNQSALLAKYVARKCGMRFSACMLERVQDTEQQATLSRDERAKNVQDAFRVRKRRASEKLILVDDVVTTGTTVNACIETLTLAGYEVLAVASIAAVD